MLLNEIPPALVESFAEDRLLLFAGAGISLASGLPTGGQLAFQLQNELFRNKFDAVRPSPESPQPLELVAQRYQVAFGRQRLNELLLKTFQKDGLKPNEAHRTAVGLFKKIATTNFDTLLEDAVRGLGRYPIVVIRDLQIPNTSIPDRTVIYKLHGDISTPDRIVITQRDYTRVPLTDGLRTELRSMMMTRGLVFVGYSLGDSDFLRQLDLCRMVLGQAMLKSYAIIPGAEKDPLFVKQCEEDNIDILSDTAADFFSDLLQAIANRSVPGAPPPPSGIEVSVPEAERGYREAVCEEFKWIDFKGIPVLGGYLRVAVDQLFVSLSAAPYSELKDESASRPSRTRAPRQGLIFKETSEGRSIFEILKEQPKLVLLGDPGSGKSTLLRYIGYHLSVPEPDPATVGLDKPYLPVFIPLREYAAFLKTGKGEGIAAFLPELLRLHSLDAYTEVVRKATEKGLAILLLDGLDEVASQEERSRVSAHVREYSEACVSSRAIITSRKVGYPKAPLKNGFANFVVQPLSDQDIQVFIGLWCKATDTEAEKPNLLEAISNPRVRALAENPLLITVLARVYKAYRNLPERRAGLYAKCVEALLTTWDLMRDVPPVFQDVREANRIMGPLALWIHRDRSGQLVTKEELTNKLAELGELPRQQQPSALLSQIEERSGLVREVGLNQYAFTHLTFQEYYVAREVVSRGDAFRQVRRLLANDRWQEVIALTAGLLDDLGRKPLTDFLENFTIKPALPARPKPSQLVKLNLLIACLKDKVEPDPNIEEYVHESLLALAESNVPWTHVLPQLAGLAKTRVGCDLIRDTRTLLRDPDKQSILENVMLFGFNLFRDSQDRASFLISTFTEIPQVPPRFPPGAPMYVARMVSAAAESSSRDALMREIRAIPLERRQSFLEQIGTFGYPPQLVRLAVEVWTAPEERSTLPRSLRASAKDRAIEEPSR